MAVALQGEIACLRVLLEAKELQLAQIENSLGPLDVYDGKDNIVGPASCAFCGALGGEPHSHVLGCPFDTFLTGPGTPESRLAEWQRGHDRGMNGEREDPEWSRAERVGCATGRLARDAVLAMRRERNSSVRPVLDNSWFLGGVSSGIARGSFELVEEQRYRRGDEE